MSGTETLDGVSVALVTANVGQTHSSSTDWMIYVGYMQERPDRAICLYETPGRPPLQRWAIDYPGVQVAVRGKVDDYTAVRNKVQDVFNALHEQEQNIVAASGGTAFVYFYATNSGPLSMGFDVNRRPKLAWNFRSMRNRPA